MVALQVLVVCCVRETEFVWRISMLIREADTADKMHELLDTQILPEETTRKITAYIK